MTFPRELSLKTVNNAFYLASEPVKELNKIISTTRKISSDPVKGTLDLSKSVKDLNGQYLLKFSSQLIADFSVVLSNELKEELIIGYDQQKNEYYVDRTKAGKRNFEIGFAKKHTAPRISASAFMDLTLLVDAASIELFADEGLSVMTDIFFPNQIMTRLKVKTSTPMKLHDVSISKVEGVWK